MLPTCTAAAITHAASTATADAHARLPSMPTCWELGTPGACYQQAAHTALARGGVPGNGRTVQICPHQGLQQAVHAGGIDASRSCASCWEVRLRVALLLQAIAASRAAVVIGVQREEVQVAPPARLWQRSGAW